MSYIVDCSSTIGGWERKCPQYGLKCTFDKKVVADSEQAARKVFFQASGIMCDRCLIWGNIAPSACVASVVVVVIRPTAYCDSD